jgi:hypothetical protein
MTILLHADSPIDPIPIFLHSTYYSPHLNKVYTSKTSINIRISQSS